MSETVRNPTRLWLIEDNRAYREELVELLKLDDAFRCSGSFGSFDEARESLDHAELPDLILIDLNLPGTKGVEAIAELQRTHPGILSLVLTVAGHRKSLFDALRAGASGYLLKSESLDAIVHHIHETMAGGAPMSSAVTPYFIESLKSGPAVGASGPSPEESGLNLRETEILELLAEGRSRGEIADSLSIATTTVDYHTQNLYRKLGVRSTSGAVGKAFRTGILH